MNEEEEKEEVKSLLGKAIISTCKLMVKKASTNK